MKADGSDATTKVKPAPNGTGLQKKPATMMEWLGAVAPRFAQYLPKGMDPDRFMRIVIRAFVQNPRLAQCTKESIIIAVGEAAELGLVPNGVLGHACIIPYKNHGKLEAAFQPMYKGLLELMYRSQKFLVITADEVCAKDDFDFEKGLNARLYHKPAIEDRGEPTTYYAYYKTTNGGFDFVVMSKKECLAWGEKYSPSWDDKSSAWHTAPGEMCKKTVLWRLGKYSPVSVDLPSEIPEERPAEAARFADLMKDVINIEPDKEGGGDMGTGAATEGSGGKEEKPAGQTQQESPPAGAQTPGPTSGAAGAPTQGVGERDPAGSGQSGAWTTGEPGAEATTHGGRSDPSPRLDPARPMTADEKAAAKAIKDRELKEGGGKKGSGVLGLFGVEPKGKLNTETREREQAPADDPDGPNGLV